MKNFTLFLSLLCIISNLQAQDYKINFAGTGDTSTVVTVKVENLTQRKSVTLNGSEVLHLVSTSTGIDPTFNDPDNFLRIYPNPTTESSTIEFFASASGVINIELFDITGKRIIAAKNSLTTGYHSYRVSGLSSGIYSVRIYSQVVSFTGKLICNLMQNSTVKISYLGKSVTPPTFKVLKSASAEKIMQYNSGDLLKYTGTSGKYSTITTDTPTQSKTLTFNFVACTDADGRNYPVIQIGAQIWMAENLAYLPLVGPPSIRSRTTRHCYVYDYFGNNVTEAKLTVNYSTYGVLYNWLAALPFCPTGWHLPNDDEWTVLSTFLGVGAGGKLKESGYDHWVSPNTGATNASGFTALPAGYVGYGEQGNYFHMIGIGGDWWSSTEHSANDARSDGVSTNFSHIASIYTGKEDGYSVRLIKDVITTSAKSLTATSMICGGNIIDDFGSTVVERGVCYNISPNPTIANNKKVMGSGKGAYNNTIAGLTANTTYYVKAYAKKNEGIIYGNEVIFKTFTGTVSDIDGNVYNTVTIGTQVWMVENLKTTKYIDGTSIPNVTDDAAWAELNSPGYCWYSNDATTYKNKYGALYNLLAVNTNKLAPTGWHIPTETEWTILTDYLGGEIDAGGKLKETGIDHWASPNIGATNSSSFSALPAGYRDDNGFYSKDRLGNWWSSTMYNPSSAMSLGIWYKRINTDSYSDFTRLGLSVRCIKGVNSELPTIFTTNVTYLTQGTALSGGNIFNDGGSPVKARGVCYSTSQLPTLENRFTSNGTGTGPFSSNLTDLISNTRYYVRAYATNNLGTSYGDQYSYLDSPYAGDYHCLGYRIHPTAGLQPVDENEALVASINDKTLIKSLVGNYPYNAQLEITPNLIVVAGMNCFKVNVTIIDPATSLVVEGGMYSTFHGDNKQLPMPATNDVNYYNPATKTFVLNYFYNSTTPRVIYEVLTKQ